MAYHLIQLAPGAYDVLHYGELVASVVRHGPRSSSMWSAELLTDLPPPHRPAPFTDTEHQFRTFQDLCDWLGGPPVKAIRRTRDMI
jgi:hypothetical protein